MNNDLISREALKDEIRHQISKYNSGLDVFTTKRIFKLIDNAPTVEPTYVSDMPDDIVKDLKELAIDYGEGIAVFERKRPQGEMQIDMSDNERFIVFNITEIDGTYDITTKESCAKGYGCRGLPPTEVFKTMQEMYKWLHDWVGFDVVFAFEES